MAGRPADRTGVSRHRAKGQPRAREDFRVGIEHRLIAGQRRLTVAVEGVAILHRELATPHHAEARPTLVAEFGLDLKKIFRHLPIAANFLTGDIGDHLFGGGLHDEVALVSIADAKQFRAVLLPAPRLLPQFSRLDHRHQEFDGTRAGHFLTNDGLDLADHPQAHRHIGVHAARQLSDHARAGHQLMADHLRIGRRFLER